VFTCFSCENGLFEFMCSFLAVQTENREKKVKKGWLS